MVKGFISKLESATEFQKLLSLFKQNGIDAHNVTINQPFAQFASTLHHGDKLLLISYSDVFLGLSDMFEHCLTLADKGIEIRSIREQDIVFSDKHLPMMRNLHTIGRDMRSQRTLRGVNKAKAEGRRLGRPGGSVKLNPKAIAADKLHKESGMTVVQACKIAGCTPQTYYRFMRTIK